MQQQERVRGRGPLGAVKSVAPLCVDVLSRQQVHTPAFDGNPSALGLNVMWGTADKIAEDLPPDRRVTGEQPWHQGLVTDIYCIAPRRAVR